MRNHIAFKFLAVILCAASLLAAVGSAAGILALTEADLYNKSVDQVVDEKLQNDGGQYANILALRYAGRNLGGCPESMIRERYNAIWFNESYNPEYYGYAIMDSEGNVLDSYNPEVKAGEYRVSTFTPSGQYMYLVSAEPENQEEILLSELPQEDALDGRYGVFDAVPPKGVVVSSVSYTTEDGESVGASSGDGMGLLYYNQDGELVFHTFYSGMLDISWPVSVTKITFRTQEGEVVYSASEPYSVGTLYPDEQGSVIFSVSGDSLLEEVAQISEVVFRDEEGIDIYRISGQPAVGSLYRDADGQLLFRSDYTESNPSISEDVIAGATFRDENGVAVYEDFRTEGIGSVSYNAAGNLIFRTLVPVVTDPVPSETSVTETVPEQTVAETWEQPPAEEADPQEDTSGGEENTPQEGEQTWEEPGQNDTENAGEPPAGETVAGENAWPEEGAGEQEGTGEQEGAGEQESAEPEQTQPPTEPPATTAPTVPQETAPAVAAAEPVLINGRSLDEYSINHLSYYDSEQQRQMDASYVYTPMPEYTVELYFAPGAMRYASVYTVLRVVRQFRNDLFLILGLSLLVTAALVVYLCCSAGRNPKSAEVRAAGLNAMPLDLYLGLTVLVITGVGVLGIKGTDYLLRQTVQTGCAFAISAAYCVCLLIVGFCFAFVAQIKTPGGFWWRNTLCGRCLRLLARFAVWLEKFLFLKCFPALGGLCRKLWQMVRRFFRWLGSLIQRFLSLLPLTWQWVLTGCVLIFVLALTTNSRSGLVVLFGVVFALGVILYAAHCFGILLESTKRMSKGDLDTKVEDKTLGGCFREFAGDLNALADVAVVAAQKQLKSERMKTELITNVSHDIKTPLTSIINYVDLLQKPHTDQEQEQYLEVLSRQSLRLKKLIDDLMDMSKASTGNMTVEVTKLDAVESVNQALGEFADKLDKAQLIPVFRHTEESMAMMADGRLVWRVMSNLLSNAVKYAMPGTRLYVDLMRVEGKVVISMKNISREELNIDADELMERFVRGDDSRNTEGSGLGLNIAKSLMELQKGQLQLLVDGDLFKVTLIFPGM